MDFNHTEDRRMLGDTLGRYLQDRYPIDQRHAISASDAGWSPDHWSALADLGIIGALFSEKAGGFAGTGFDIAVIFEQLGRALVTEPFLGTLMGGRALANGRSEGLPESVVAGTTLLTFAHEEPESHYESFDVVSRATRTADGWLLDGRKAVVLQVEASDYIVVSARISDDGGRQGAIGLFLLDKGASGVSIRGYPLIDGGRAGELVMNGAPATLVAEHGLSIIEDSTAAGIVALCWEAIGVMDALKTATLDYLRTRKQFGVPIGKFQALQHRMATVALEIEQARSTAINAADALEKDRSTRERAVSAAKFTIGRVGTLVAEEAIQMHGGIGMTWELPLSHHAKRLTMIGHQLGDEDYHLARYIELGRAA